MTRLHDATHRGFASDNQAGVHPELLDAIAEANEGHQSSYGADAYTAHLQEVIGAHFGAGAVAFPVFNGTGANVLALQAVSPRWGAVICAETSHVNADETAAPESVAGLKVFAVPTDDGKLTTELIDRYPWAWGDEHRAQPSVVSIAQATEVGTVYTPAEIKVIADFVHEKGMVLHVDGSRLANAAAHLGTGFAAFTSDVGVDIVSFGGAKNGLLYGEAIVVPRPAGHAAVTASLPFLRKLDLQLASKMRFLSAQFIALLENGLWLRSAQHANAMAARLAEQVNGVDGVQITQPVQSNGVFAKLDRAVANELRKSFDFYDWDTKTSEVRWMCAFDTTEADVDGFVAELKRLVATR
ncbi:MAG: threonine aldolase family protein [Jatrophihabitans sp.]